ncbi:sulfatase-like hydrolase/transferase [Paractinoplanes durhamensis]|uniref:sulfatase-like hydrolase/transferase n=1 Tax=Paractinoplanes durhamensis TaxID=113563 RepID=UPI001EF29E26|nr:sulfatase-like hydrolase/transferase [Actinoplanes durhamensis]
MILFVALIFPNVVSRLTPIGFLRIPVEGAFLIALLLVPARARRIAGIAVGVLLGWLVIEKCLDMGFFSELNRPFDPVLDWVLFDDAYSFVVDSYGKAAALGAVAAILLLVAAVMSLTTWSVLRIGRLVGAHHRRSLVAAGAIAVAWAATFAFGASFTGAVPIAARSSATYAWDRAHQAKAGFADASNFAKEVKNDPYATVPSDQMLTALKGKDVIFTFIESYGRSAVEHPALAPLVDPVLDAGTAQLTAAGFSSESGWLTSPTFGGGSWLAHSTFESGLWINNEQRYRNLVSTNRLTLTRSFKNAGYRTVSVMPGATRAWPEGKFYGYDAVWDSRNLGYQGPKFSWAPMPDQYTLKQLNTIEYQKASRTPLMVEMPLVSSHTPWAPIPSYLDNWDQIGDGSIYASMAADGKKPKALWANPRDVRPEYGKSIVYSVTSLVNWVTKYGDDNLVLVFLGDHQPSPIASGAGASHDVPISIVTKDKALLERITDWKWAPGLRPAGDTPVWPMNAFRDRFFTAFGPKAAAS